MGNINDTTCSVFSTCSIENGATTNGTLYVAQYDPSVPVPYWHWHMELATIIICSSFTFGLIFVRLWYRLVKLGQVRADDLWMAVAGLFLIPYTASQIGTNKNGSGLHVQNVPISWREGHWHYQIGWAGYYIVVSCIKLSVCFFFLDVLIRIRSNLKLYVYVLCAIIGGLGITLTCSWLFTCSPFLSNFLWTIDSEICLNFDIFRWLWIGILKRAKLKKHEIHILKMVFCATFLGTITCAIGILGAYKARTVMDNDAFWQETSLVMMNDIEIFMHALGATFPVFSRHLISMVSSDARDQHANFTSWAHYAPDIYIPDVQTAHGSTTTDTETSLQQHGDTSNEYLVSVLASPISIWRKV